MNQGSRGQDEGLPSITSVLKMTDWDGWWPSSRSEQTLDVRTCPGRDSNPGSFTVQCCDCPTTRPPRLHSRTSGTKIWILTNFCRIFSWPPLQCVQPRQSSELSYLWECQYSQQLQWQPWEESQWWWRPPRPLSCWPWSRVYPSPWRCGSYQPCSQGRQSCALAWMHHPWGRPCTFPYGAWNASLARILWIHDGVLQTFCETETKQILE